MTSSGTASLGAAPLVGLSYDVGAGSGFSVSLTTEFLTIDFAVMVGLDGQGGPASTYQLPVTGVCNFRYFASGWRRLCASEIAIPLDRQKTLIQKLIMASRLIFINVVVWFYIMGVSVNRCWISSKSIQVSRFWAGERNR